MDCIGGTKGEGFFIAKRPTYTDRLKMAMGEKPVGKLLSSTKCESCGQHYEPVRISVLKQRQSWLLSMHFTFAKQFAEEIHFRLSFL